MMKKSNTQPKTFCSDDKLGKINPKSKKLNLTKSNKNYLENKIIDSSFSISAFSPQNNRQKQPDTQGNSQKTGSKQSKFKEIHGQTTIPKRKRELKSGIKSQVKQNQYVYMIDSKTDKLKKYLLISEKDINFKFGNSEQNLPPFQSCDEDVESTEDVVEKGIQRSKRDLFDGMQTVKKLKRMRQNKLTHLNDFELGLEAYQTDSSAQNIHKNDELGLI